MNKFQWNYPSEGLRFPRTLEQAFQPGAKLYVKPPLITKSGILYALAGVFALSALAIAIATR